MSQSYSQGSSSGSQSNSRKREKKFRKNQGDFLRITKQLIRAGYNRFYDPLQKSTSSKYCKIYFKDKLTRKFVRYINYLKKTKR